MFKVLKYSRLSLVISIALTGLWCESVAQISWKTKPDQLQFIPRNLSTNRGQVLFSGDVTSSLFNQIEIQVFRNGIFYSRSISGLSFTGSSASFIVTVNLPAGRYMYTTVVNLIGTAGSREIYRAEKLAVGDAFLISGQSNSVANSYNGLANTNYRDSLIRSYGSSSPGAAAATSDTGWYVADGDGLYNKGCVGQWGLVMARKIVDSLQVPVCIINAGVGGTAIGFHQKSSTNPFDPNTNYGRMLTRAERSGLRGFIRGIFWFQGESDGSNAALHDSLYRKMHLDWLKDYPATRKVYVVQVRSGCGSPTIELREKQRQLRNLFRCEVFTANGLNAHDGCHYGFRNGYEQLGFQLYNAVSSDIYGKPRIADNYPLQPLRAWYSKGDRTEICLEFEGEPSVIAADTMFHSLFRLQGGTASIVSGTRRNGRVYLRLSRADCDIRGISYDGLAGSRPWVKTRNGAALMSFYNLPVLRTFIPSSVSGCEGSKVRLGRDSVPGYNYDWTGLLSGRKSSRAAPEFKVGQTERFMLITTASSGTCAGDTVFQQIYSEVIPSVRLPRDTSACPGDTITIVPFIQPALSTGSWMLGNSLVSGTAKLLISTPGTYVLRMLSDKGCSSSDTLLLTFHQPLPRHLPRQLSLCQGTDSLLTSDNRAILSIWNERDTATNYRVSSQSGRQVLMQISDKGCVSRDTCIISELQAVPIGLDSVFTVCPNDSLILKLPNTHNNWFYRNKQINNFLILKPGESGRLQSTDSQQCLASSRIQINTGEVIPFSLKDTLICTGDSIVVSGPQGGASYSWNSGQNTENAVFRNRGTYALTVAHPAGCLSADSFVLETKTRPLFKAGSDTFFCTGDSFVIRRAMTDAAYFYLNGQIWTREVVIKKPAVYSWRIFDEPGCSTNGNIEIYERTCHNSLKKEALSGINYKAGPSEITLSCAHSGFLRVLISDAAGRIVADIIPGQDEKELIIKGLPSGRILFVSLILRSSESIYRTTTIKVVLP